MWPKTDPYASSSSYLELFPPLLSWVGHCSSHQQFLSVYSQEQASLRSECHRCPFCQQSIDWWSGYSYWRRSTSCFVPISCSILSRSSGEQNVFIVVVISHLLPGVISPNKCLFMFFGTLIVYPSLPLYPLSWMFFDEGLAVWLVLLCVSSAWSDIFVCFVRLVWLFDDELWV